MNVAYVKRIISRSFQCIILVIAYLIIYPVVIIAEKSGLSIGLAIDTYSIRLFHDVSKIQTDGINHGQ